MRSTTAQKVTLFLTVVACGAAIGAVLWFRPVPVESVAAQYTPMEVTVTLPGRTRHRDTFQITAPVAGRVVEIVKADDGSAPAEGAPQERLLVALQPVKPGNGDNTTAEATKEQACCVRVLAPSSVRILRALQPVGAVVAAGAPLVEAGASTGVEVVADLPPPQRGKIGEGAAVAVAGWGGPRLNGRVASVPPADAPKDAPQRLVVAVTEPPAAWTRVTADTRVSLEIVVWKSDRVLALPASAVRSNPQGSSVFVLKDGVVKLTPVKVGQRSATHVEIVEGLAAGDQVVNDPSVELEDGTRVSASL